MYHALSQVTSRAPSDAGSAPDRRPLHPLAVPEHPGFRHSEKARIGKAFYIKGASPCLSFSLPPGKREVGLQFSLIYYMSTLTLTAFDGSGSLQLNLCSNAEYALQFGCQTLLQFINSCRSIEG